MSSGRAAGSQSATLAALNSSCMPPRLGAWRVLHLRGVAFLDSASVTGGVDLDVLDDASYVTKRVAEGGVRPIELVELLANRVHRTQV